MRLLITVTSMFFAFRLACKWQIMRDPVETSDELHYNTSETQRELLAMVLARDAEDTFTELLPADPDQLQLYVLGPCYLLEATVLFSATKLTCVRVRV